MTGPTNAEIDPHKRDIIRVMSADRVFAHEYIFKHRHKNETPEFHREIIDLCHSDSQLISIMAFRGGAKSTIVAEEATCIRALLGEFRNGLIVGETYDRAKERLAAIKHELETNEFIQQVFGNQIGTTWTENKIELPNGTVIQSLGRGQSLRGSKHHDQRPDYLVIDDLEDEESVRTEEARKATIAWVISVLLPAMDKNYIARVIGTPLEADSLMDQLEKDSGWISRRYPIEYVDHIGERKATWQDRFSLDEIDKIKGSFTRMGMLLQFGREYLCEARSGETRVFTKDMIRVEPRVRRWEAVYAMYDPARTVKSTSAHTGKVVFSWVGQRLVVWEASGHFWLPDQIVNDMFETAERYNPAVIGFERDGLEEWGMQAIRSEMTKRGVILPLRAMKAPKGKLDFIRGLQPFFMSGELTMAQECPDLREQLLNFPVGRIDVPNALAYALVMRPGLPVYEDFNQEHIVEEFTRPTDLTVAIGSHDGILTGILYSRARGRVSVWGDMIIEGDPQQRVGDVIEWAREQGAKDTVVHPDHMERYSTSGLVGTLRKLGASPRRGGDAGKGRIEIVRLLRNKRNAEPLFRVRGSARWTLNAMSGGYAMEYPKAGKGLSDRAADTMYRTLMEVFESGVALAAGGQERDSNIKYKTAPDGRKYISSV